MQCPICNGHAVQALGGDRFECVSQVRVGDKLVGVVPPNPYQPFEIPVFHSTYAPCGHRFTGEQAAAARDKRTRTARRQAEAAHLQAEAERSRAKEVRARSEAARAQAHAKAVEFAQRRAWEDERDAKVDEALPIVPRPDAPVPSRARPTKYLIRTALGSVVLGWALTAISAGPGSSLGDEDVQRLWLAITAGSFVLSVLVGVIWAAWAPVRRAVTELSYERRVRACDEREEARERLRAALDSTRQR